MDYVVKVLIFFLWIGIMTALATAGMFIVLGPLIMTLVTASRPGLIVILWLLNRRRSKEK